MYVTHTHIDNSVPMEEEVEWEVRRLWGNRSGGPFRMHAENLRECLWEHRASEAAVGAEATSEPEVRERGAEEGVEDGRGEVD